MAKNKGWIDDVVSVDKLSLDLQNPRIPMHVKDQKNRTLIRNHLLDKENVLRIARNIVQNGYHKSAVSIVYKEDENLIVLDGNRRLAACQFLLDPTLAPDARSKKELESMTRSFDKNQLDNIKITIAPSRKEAEKEIWDIHVNQLLKPWEVLQKLRMYRNLIDDREYTVSSASSEYGVSLVDFKRQLAMLYFYDRILEAVDDKGEEELLKSGFNKIDRVILSKNGQKILGYMVNDKGDIVINNKTDFEKKLKKIIPYIIIHDKIDAQISQDELKRYVYPEIDPVLFPKGKKGIKKNGPTTIVKAEEQTPEVLQIFVIMAFAGLDDVYKAIGDVADELFHKRANVNRIDYSSGARNTQDQKIEDALNNSGFLIAVLSMGDKEKLVYEAIKNHKKAKEILEQSYPINSNVLVELGYGLKCILARDKKKDMFLLVDGTKDDSFPTLEKFCQNGFFDLRQRGQICYNDIEDLKKKLKKNFIRNASAKKYLLKK